MDQANGSVAIIPDGLNNRREMRLNLYYLFWADAISSFRKHHPDKKSWRIRLLLLNSWIHALNLWIVYIWIKHFSLFDIPLIRINLFPGEMLDDFFAFTIEFALPFIIMNYFLVFHKRRYERILKKYDDMKTRYVLVYSFSVIIGAFVTALFHGILY